MCKHVSNAANLLAETLSNLSQVFYEKILNQTELYYSEEPRKDLEFEAGES